MEPVQEIMEFLFFTVNGSVRIKLQKKLYNIIIHSDDLDEIFPDEYFTVFYFILLFLQCVIL